MTSITWLDEFKIRHVQFIDGWYQNEKPREIYFWMNNIYL